MKEYEVTFSVLADDYKHAVKICEPIQKYFLADNMCTLDLIRLKHPDSSEINSDTHKKTANLG